MIWNGKFTVSDMAFIFGVLAGLAIAGLVCLAVLLWAARMMVGG